MNLGVGRTRTASVVWHLFSIAAGLGTIINPTRVITDFAGAWAYIWAGLFITGGILCAFAAWRRNFLLEVGGLPMEIGAYFILVVILSWGWLAEGTSWMFIVACLFSSSVAGLTGRLIEMRRLSKVSEEALTRQRKRKE
jgi:hypothetical protein